VTFTIAAFMREDLIPAMVGSLMVRPVPLRSIPLRLLRES
jgi:hypothetical protein